MSSISDLRGARLRLRVVYDTNAMIGPGKADLLQFIKETGSISAAGRRMKMSYKRAWGLVETMNGFFRVPVVERTRGGASGGGARLTEAGEQILAHYRNLESLTAAHGREDIAAIADLLIEKD